MKFDFRRKKKKNSYVFNFSFVGINIENILVKIHIFELDKLTNHFDSVTFYFYEYACFSQHIHVYLFFLLNGIIHVYLCSEGWENIKYYIYIYENKKEKTKFYYFLINPKFFFSRINKWLKCNIYSLVLKF